MNGDIWKYSDQLDENDIRFAMHDFVTYGSAVEYYGLGLKVITRIAWECGSVYKIGKKVLIRRDVLEAYLRQQQSSRNMKTIEYEINKKEGM